MDKEVGCHTKGRLQVWVEISKKNLHPAHVPYGGMFLEVKNPKNRTPKVILHPNSIFKSHHFVVIVRSVEETGPSDMDLSW